MHWKRQRVRAAGGRLEACLRGGGFTRWCETGRGDTVCLTGCFRRRSGGWCYLGEFTAQTMAVITLHRYWNLFRLSQRTSASLSECIQPEARWFWMESAELAGCVCPLVLMAALEKPSIKFLFRVSLERVHRNMVMAVRWILLNTEFPPVLICFPFPCTASWAVPVAWCNYTSIH